MIRNGDIVRLKEGSKSFPFLGRTKTYFVKAVQGTTLRLAGHHSFMASKEFDKVTKDNG